MLREEYNQVFTALYLVFLSGAAIVLTVVAFNLLADAS